MDLQTRTEENFSVRPCLLFLFIITLVSNGCTMCPSPFDYSGTVPGSANQNDFRIRANGILPIWKRPKPWPPIVSFEKKATHAPTAGPIEDTSSVPRVIVASHEEELQAVRENSSVLIRQMPQAVSIDEDKRTEVDTPTSTEKVGIDTES